MIYNLASNMGGMGFIENNKALCMRQRADQHAHAGRRQGSRHRAVLLFVLRLRLQRRQAERQPTSPRLKEEDAYPALPEDGYGWEKLFSERMCRHFREDYGIATRVARFHNVYGPFGTWDGGREKAPAAICRKVIAAKLSGKHDIEIWGDGEQTRSFMYIDDCLKGIDKITDSDIIEPINLGSDELVSINQLVDIVEEIAGMKLKRSYNLDAPKGVHGRNSDNTLIKKLMDWEPSIRLEDGMEKTYKWIYDEMTSGKVSVVNALPKQALAAQ